MAENKWISVLDEFPAVTKDWTDDESEEIRHAGYVSDPVLVWGRISDSDDDFTFLIARYIEFVTNDGTKEIAWENPYTQSDYVKYEVKAWMPLSHLEPYME